MRTYQKEILISIAALLVMTLAIVSFFKTMNREKANEKEDIYRLITSDVNGIMVVNRPAIFDRMVLEKQSFFNLFASEVPEIFLSFIRNNRQIDLIMFSFHPQGVVCYVQTNSRALSSIEKKLSEEYSSYSPIKQQIDGLTYHFYPDTGNRFFGYYMQHGVWVGSYSKKLLENTVTRHQQESYSLPAEMKKQINSFDVNAPVNLIFPTEKLDLRVSQGNSSFSVKEKWLAADLFVNEGNLCCYGALPYQSSVGYALYEAMGEVLVQQLTKLYPRLSLSFQVNREDDFVYYTGCTPLPE